MGSPPCSTGGRSSIPRPCCTCAQLTPTKCCWPVNGPDWHKRGRLRIFSAAAHQTFKSSCVIICGTFISPFSLAVLLHRSAASRHQLPPLARAFLPRCGRGSAQTTTICLRAPFVTLRRACATQRHPLSAGSRLPGRHGIATVLPRGTRSCSSGQYRSNTVAPRQQAGRRAVVPLALLPAGLEDAVRRNPWV